MNRITDMIIQLPAYEKFSILVMKNPINHPRGKLIIQHLMSMPKKPVIQANDQLSNNIKVEKDSNFCMHVEKLINSTQPK